MAQPSFQPAPMVGAPALPRLDPATLDALFKAADINGDGRISRAEFMRLLRGPGSAADEAGAGAATTTTTVQRTDTSFPYHDAIFGPSWRYHYPDSLDEKLLRGTIGQHRHATPLEELRHEAFMQAVNAKRNAELAARTQAQYRPHTHDVVL
eukprot:TRINITY_DN22426_c0_g4_i1.p1 TRINITY_DN22426_c0_g4~~TRINITY_DN22426_c0_g4_i1.p1  ORF type:complete len:152 (+),score=28.49 TRINITY_DN22426_c0_g4_i1:81-536(+)